MDNTKAMLACLTLVYLCMVKHMNNADEANKGNRSKILVANHNELGRKEFGRIVQIKRQDAGLSIAKLASRVALSEGTLRAIERGARAPSENSGIRILSELFADDDWTANFYGPSLHRVVSPDGSGPMIVEFGAKVSGDNGTWSRNRKIEEVERRGQKFLEENPQILEGHLKNFSNLANVMGTYVEILNEPISDQSLGRIVRRLPEITNLQAERLEKLLWLWSQINQNLMTEEASKEIKMIESTLDSFLSEDEL